MCRSNSFIDIFPVAIRDSRKYFLRRRIDYIYCFTARTVNPFSFYKLFIIINQIDSLQIFHIVLFILKAVFRNKNNIKKPEENIFRSLIIYGKFQRN